MAPIIDYQGKTAVVTGAATGVGAALVERLRVMRRGHCRRRGSQAVQRTLDATVIADLSIPTRWPRRSANFARSNRCAVQQCRRRGDAAQRPR